jgi:23S rRNA (guanine745-N1)-methyltransferase
LSAGGAAARCENGHSHDFAASGYLNLLSGRGSRRMGDTRAMARARAEFLAAGHLDPVADAVAAAAATGLADASAVAEVGSGTGHYLRRALDRAGGARCAVGVDLSKDAADIAARANPGLLFVVADAESRIPLVDGAAGALLSVFAPRPVVECARVVRSGGRLVACFANPDHLASLRTALGLMSVGPDKLETLSTRLGPAFTLESATPVGFGLTLEPRYLRRLVEMGPNARHVESLRLPDGPTEVAVSVTVATFRRS